MSEVSVIGLGEMGTALAAALVRHGKKVTVWNRSPEKAAALVAAGALLAPDSAAAIRASPVVILCVSNYAATRAILEPTDVSSGLPGKLVVQLSTGTPKEARELETWVQARSARYVDGAILAWPRQIGGADAVILVSGSAEAQAQGHSLLSLLAGGLTSMGPEVGASSSLFAAVLAYLAGRWIGLSHGALICEAEGLDVAAYGALLANLAPILGQDAKHMGDVIAKNAFTSPESTLRTAAGDISGLMRHSQEARINGEFPRFAADLFARAVRAGHGAEEHAAIIKVLRQA
ncbi:coenzyme F420-dependent NADP oxidoreductase [Myxococcus stipitatus DSM 14675]|uniref:Coenzyme F420-dependent NADP oxidoreductase n=2 Tax=Myxococcus stipitatus TaxID=83455 RepID=L7U6N2_MYXSD|nr:coenzyme F420-dependent NADP oxidoreductase [Myxococcus stipitatus DSM 14675]